MRGIIHLDMDAFFAAVEQRDNPELKGKPVIVGGIGKRGVVSTCSYEARRYGVRSAMPWFQASKLCPEGIFLPGRYSRYKEVSRQVFAILKRYTELIEPLSIDEAFLDVTDAGRSPLEIAVEIKAAVLEETGLTVSVGIAYNKFLAKLASEWNKPDGLFEIRPEDVPDILKPLPVSKVYGLGAQSVGRLNRIGIFTVADLLKYDKDFLVRYLGGHGGEIYHLIRGEDQRPVNAGHQVKSIGRETTLSEDCRDTGMLLEHLAPFCDVLEVRLARYGLRAYTITLKYKTAGFRQYTRSRTVSIPVGTAEEMMQVLQELMAPEVVAEPVRLIGVTLSHFEETRTEQIRFPMELLGGYSH